MENLDTLYDHIHAVSSEKIKKLKSIKDEYDMENFTVDALIKLESLIDKYLNQRIKKEVTIRYVIMLKNIQCKIRLHTSDSINKVLNEQYKEHYDQYFCGYCENKIKELVSDIDMSIKTIRRFIK